MSRSDEYGDSCQTVITLNHPHPANIVICEPKHEDTYGKSLMQPLKVLRSVNSVVLYLQVTGTVNTHRNKPLSFGVYFFMWTTNSCFLKAYSAWPAKRALEQYEVHITVFYMRWILFDSTVRRYKLSAKKAIREIREVTCFWRAERKAWQNAQLCFSANKPPFLQQLLQVDWLLVPLTLASCRPEQGFNRFTLTASPERFSQSAARSEAFTLSWWWWGQPVSGKKWSVHVELVVAGPARSVVPCSNS